VSAKNLRTLRRLGVRYLGPQQGDDPSGAPVEIPSGSTLVGEPALPPQSTPPQAPPAPGGVPGIVKSGPQTDRMAALFASVHECQKCPLGKTRLNFVFGSGDPSCEVVFVGEAPGADEDEQGLPFVGRAGQLLTKIIESTKTWKREDVFICNILKCRPPGNRTPSPDEVEACRPHLEAQLAILRPKLIMAMGTTAAQALLRSKEAVGKLRGRWHNLGGVPLRVTYHPAALLRTEAYKKDVWEDMKVLTAKYKEIKNEEGV